MEYSPPMEDDMWAAVGRPAARVEPAYIGDSWYVVAATDLKGLERGGAVAQGRANMVDDLVFDADKAGAFQNLPPRGYYQQWQADACPIA